MKTKALRLFTAIFFALSCCFFLQSCKNKNKVIINPDSIATITLEIPVDQILMELNHVTSETGDPIFEDAIKNTDKESSDYIAEFCKNYTKAGGDVRYAFKYQIPKIAQNPQAKDEEIYGYIEEEVDNIIKNSCDILSERLNKIGISSFEIETSSKLGIITITMPNVDNMDDMDRVIGLLCNKGNLEIYETYNCYEIANQIKELSDKYQTSASEENTKAKTLISMLGSSDPSSCVVGHVLASDKIAVDSILSSKLAKETLDKNLKLCWTVKAENSSKKGEEIYGLVALKMKRTIDSFWGPFLYGEIVSNTRTKDNVVRITLNEEGGKLFSHLTGDNIGRPISIVVDDKVYSYPFVEEKIYNERFEISGDYTEKEIFDLNILIECGAMKARPRIIGKIIKEK